MYPRHYVIQTLNGRIYQRIAWTGGEHPGACTGLDWSIVPELMAPLNYLRGLMYREQLADFVGYWGDMPNRDTRYIFWRRATADAYATLTRQS